MIRNPDLQGISASKFVMFRCLVTMGHADGILCDREKEYLRGLLDANRLSRVQKQTIENDFADPVPLRLLLPLITDPLYRGQLVYFAQLMAYKDGHLHPTEAELIEKLRTYLLDEGQLNDLKAIAGDLTARDMRAHDTAAGDGVTGERPGGNIDPRVQGWFAFFFDLLSVIRFFM